MVFALLPDLPFMYQQDLAYIPLENESIISFGLYYKSSFNSSVLKAFIQILKDFCNDEIFYDDWMPELGRFLG